jgi:hypothetical protein
VGGESIRVCNSAWVDGSKVKPDPPLEKGSGSASHRKGWQGADGDWSGPTPSDSTPLRIGCSEPNTELIASS